MRHELCVLDPEPKRHQRPDVAEYRVTYRLLKGAPTLF